MDRVLSSLAISMSEFKKNPSKVLREAGRHPLAVLTHNKPACYVIDPEVYEAMLERLEDLELGELAAKRLASGKRVRVRLDDL